MADKYSYVMKQDNVPVQLTKLKFVLIASQFGSHFVKDVKAINRMIDLLSGRPGKPPHVAHGLLSLSGKPLIEFWMSALMTSERLVPASEKVFVVTNAENHDDYAHWARTMGANFGFSEANLWCTGREVTDEPRWGPIEDLAAFVKAKGFENDHLMVAEAHAVMDPKYNIVRTIEYSMVRAADTVTYYVPHAGFPLDGLVTVKLDDHTLSNPQVLGFDLHPKGVSDGKSVAAVTPLFILRRGSMPALFSAAAGGVEHGPNQLARFFASLHKAGRPVYAIGNELYFHVHRLADYQLADQFFREYFHQVALGAMGSKPAWAQATLDLTADGRLEAKAKDTSVRAQFLEWLPTYEASKTARLTGEVAVGPLPDRFVDPSTWRHKPKKQHPFYQTTAHQVGIKHPAVKDMPTTWAGSKQQFTQSFTGMYRSQGLKTGIDHSKAYDAPAKQWIHGPAAY